MSRMSEVQGNRSPRVTLKDVAAHAGVSTATVSDIVNRGLSKNYTEATTRGVRRSIELLGYRATVAAQQLRRGRTETIGVVLTRGFENPFYARLYDSLQRSVRGFGLTSELLILDDHSPDEVDRLCTSLLGQKVDAVIMGPVYYSDEQLIHELQRRRLNDIPLLTFGSIKDNLGADHVVLGDPDAGRLAVDYLVSKGHRRLGYLQAYPEEHARKGLGRGSFQQGIEEGLVSAGVRDEALLIKSSEFGNGPDELSTARAFASWWFQADPKTRPSALICVNDHLAIATLSILHRHGIRVPHDLSVIGYDNTSESAFTIPSLTTIDNAMSCRILSIARRAAKLAGRRDEGQSMAASFAPSVVERESVNVFST